MKNQNHVIKCASGSGVTVYLSDATASLEVISVTFRRDKAMPLEDADAAEHAIKILRSLYPCLNWQAATC